MAVVKEEDEIKKNVAAWIAATEQKVIELSDTNGWIVTSRGMARNSPSRYLTVHRSGETIKIRISDHKSVYKTEHFSLSPNGYDNSLSEVIARLEAQNES